MLFLAKPSCTFLIILALSVIVIYTTIRSHLNHHIAAAAAAMKNMYLFILTLSVIVIYTTIRNHLNHPIATAAMKKLYYENAFPLFSSKYAVAAYLHHLTLHPYLAGTPTTVHIALYVKAQFKAYGMDTRFANYSTFFPYPKHSSFSAQFRNGFTICLPLSKPNVPQNGIVMTYIAYSPSDMASNKAEFLKYRL
ncbi:putative glutamate carboxypeptidase 2 [Abeliophyllum distichum]|uniref:Glutamate carboxypeptidase 2 n=1 Tax=Abeliophyllum distichum TaxID=126358 RepID=A0ABD1PDT5_9LAMI